MEDENKVIHLIGIKETRPILSQIRHQVEKWISREQTLMFYPKISAYEVTLTHDESALLYTCRIQINIGGKIWFGWDSAKSLQESLERTLHHMKVDPLLGLKRLTPQHLSPSTA